MRAAIAGRSVSDRFIEERVLTKLAHVCIESADLEATERFYACLGLKRQFEFRNPAGLLIGYYLKLEDRTFLEVIRVMKPRDTGAVRHFAFESDDIDALYEKLRAAGYEATQKRLGEDNTWMVTCYDPNGVFVELHQYDAHSMQLHGGVCYIDYVPRPES
jgi:catechol 2,3-dioxygenase-like lactoylglutathione lyase family enzyme